MDSSTFLCSLVGDEGLLLPPWVSSLGSLTNICDEHVIENKGLFWLIVLESLVSD